MELTYDKLPSGFALEILNFLCVQDGELNKFTMDSTLDEFDFTDSPVSSSKEEDSSFLDNTTPISFGLPQSASSAASDKSKRKVPRNLAYSGISHQTSR